MILKYSLFDYNYIYLHCMFLQSGCFRLYDHVIIRILHAQSLG